MISLRNLAATLVIAAASASAWATIEGPGGKAATYPADATVAGDRVAIRAKAEYTSDVLIYAYTDQKLKVVAETGEWYIVELPREFPLWVSKQFVKVGANSDGEVTADRVNLRAGPGLEYNSEGQLNTKQRIEVIEEKDGWLKFRFKAGERGFVARKYVLLAGDSAPRPLPTPPKPEPPKPVPEPPKPIPVPEPPKPIPPMPEPPKPVPEDMKGDSDADVDPAVLASFNKAEEIYRAEVKKDNIAEWSLDDAYKLYVGVMEKTRNSSLLSRCRSRLAIIHLSRQYRDVAKSADPRAKLEKRAEEIEKEFAARRAKLAEEIDRLFPTCIAAGRLEKLASPWLKPATHKLMREDRVILLLRSDGVDLAAYEDKFVGVQGEIDKSVKWPIETLNVTGVVLPPENK